ncbi:hypothetical protein [Flavobacterium humidisoli]|uniref:Uncharacterized protein n=1 Tax=Flavobacterium humidisoli TaxID=2937442 RepID=A0ABY4LZ83_9FLAO|nr:hypothetical protein [Flavobacterium humidisoli]UPZ17853.1 hypothetical protein M0M44_11000 [Flavobacterium humidisoli]
MSEFWIEKACGESIDNALIAHAYAAIDQIKDINSLHGTFWIGHVEEDYVLVIHRSMRLFFIYGENRDKQLMMYVKDWAAVKLLIKNYFAKDFSILKKEFDLYKAD